jgi:hypothetical protein
MSQKQPSESRPSWFHILLTTLLAGVFSNFDYRHFFLSTAELFRWMALFFDK